MVNTHMFRYIGQWKSRYVCATHASSNKLCLSLTGILLLKDAGLVMLSFHHCALPSGLQF